MLANVLAVIIGAGSLAFYLVAFILPEVHRRSDFFWSGIGMFYAVVLWYCARQMNGAVLLGQTASVGLLLWLGYQTLLLRRETTPAAQQTPIRLGKSERSRTTSRPIAKDYEFVEDGVEDALDQEPAPDSPILIKPAADEFAPKMVVPAAMPKQITKADTPEEPPAKGDLSADIPASPQSAQPRKRPSPLAAVGIFAGWLKDMVTPKKKESKPMIELPPRPPSIPKPDTTSDMMSVADSSAKAADIETPEAMAENINTSPTSSAKDTSANLEPTAATPKADRTPRSDAIQQDDDEDSNWPEDEFWD